MRIIRILFSRIFSMQRSVFLACFLSIQLPGLLAQVTGPVCVIEGIAYQYNVNTQQQNGVEICITGGVIQYHASLCRMQAAISDVHIVWDSTVNSGKITVKAGSQTLFTHNVNVTKKLYGGKIDSLSLSQTTDTSTVPAKIKCDNAKHGNCNPSFSYQWEKSEDYLTWVPVPQGTTKDLEFSSPVVRTTYFRRTVTETTSGAKAYSDIAMVVVEY